MIVTLKNELEIFLCANASGIIENYPITKKQIPYTQHLEHTLKRIETITSIKPHLVITNINPEEMYGLESEFFSDGARKQSQANNPVPQAERINLNYQKKR